MENLFQMNFSKAQVDAISNVGLAHLGDGVFELMVRAFVCGKGNQTVRTLHGDTVKLVQATAQAQFAQRILPILTQEEADYFRRGKNAHTHAAPKAATAKDYAYATGLETLFGALYLYGRIQRLNELFEKGMETHGI